MDLPKEVTGVFTAELSSSFSQSSKGNTTNPSLPSPVESLSFVSGSITANQMSRPASKLSEILNNLQSHKILYPTRNSKCDDSSRSKGCDPEKAIKWVGLAPLDMVQHIASMAAKSSNFGAMSETAEETRDEHSFLLRFLSGGTDLPLIDSKQQNNLHAGEKRKRVTFKDTSDDECDVVEGPVFDDLRNNLDTIEVFKPWKPKKVLDEMKITTSEKENISNLVIQLDNLTSAFEDLGVSKELIPSYNRVRLLLTTRVNAGDTNAKNAVKQAIDQMQALTSMSTLSDTKAMATCVSAGKPDCTASPVLLGETFSFSEGFITPPMQAPLFSLKVANNTGADTIHSKTNWQSLTYETTPKEMRTLFTDQMSLWMRHNWANPFPDDVMLRHLADHLIRTRCITVSKSKAELLDGKRNHAYQQGMMDLVFEKISNWLVNSRTRRWRPCIQKAFDAKRPAHLLLEDSLRIFEGKELRTLPGWDGDALFAPLKDYSAPLKTWLNLKKRPGKVKNGVKKRKSTVSKHKRPVGKRTKAMEVAPDNAMSSSGRKLPSFSAVVHSLSVFDASTDENKNELMSMVPDSVTSSTGESSAGFASEVNALQVLDVLGGETEDVEYNHFAAV